MTSIHKSSQMSHNTTKTLTTTWQPFLKEILFPIVWQVDHEYIAEMEKMRDIYRIYKRADYIVDR